MAGTSSQGGSAMVQMTIAVRASTDSVSHVSTTIVKPLSAPAAEASAVGSGEVV
ncbi:MAG: hypothetical protein ACLGIZ_04005 [Acidimicrobiia bacterium]|jgi:hypothetical protein